MTEHQQQVEGLVALRAELAEMAAAVSDREQVASVTDEALHLPGRTVPLRTFTPARDTGRLLVWLHGGGYIAGSIDDVDPLCRSLANRSGHTVVAVGYRLAPEHPFPSAYDDAFAALAAIAARPGVGSVAIGGDSAGGGLAAAVAQTTPVPLSALVLLCPFLDLTLSCPSVRDQEAGGLLPTESLREFARLYAANPRDPRVSPILGPLNNLPPVVVVTAGEDPLRDEGALFVLGVQAAGGTATHARWSGMPHGFAGMTSAFPEADEALRWACANLPD